MKKGKIMQKSNFGKGVLFSILTSKLTVLVIALTFTFAFGWEAGAGSLLVGLNTDDSGDAGGDDDTVLGGDGSDGDGSGGGDEGDAGGDAGAKPWTEGLPDDLKEFFGEAKSLEEFKANMPKAAEVPEDYSYAIPDGMEGVDSEEVASFSAYAKEQGLTISQGDFEKLMEYDKARMEKMPSLILEQVEGQMKEGLEAMRAEMGEESFGETVGMAKKVIKAFGNPEVTAWLNETRMGNHPVLVKFLSSVGKGLSEDQFTGGDLSDKGEPKSAAQKLYPNQGKK